MKPSKFATMIGTLVLVAALAVPAMAQQLFNSEAPGSVIVFPKFITGTVTIDGVATPKSEFELSVTCPEGITCTEGTRVKIRFHWVCPGSQLFQDKAICKETDFVLWTTVNATLTFNAANTVVGGAVGQGGTNPGGVRLPPCARGYLIAWVINSADAPIKWDGLIGDAVLREKPASASAYNGITIQAASALAHLALTDVDGDGQLDFDGTEYAYVTGQVSGSVRYDKLDPSEVETHLTLLTLDVFSNRSNYATFVDLFFYNQNEVETSTSHEFICWSEVTLTEINGNLNETIQGTRKGLVVSGQAESFVLDPFFGVIQRPVTLLGIVETKERNANGAIAREYSYSLYHNTDPIETAFVP